MDDDEVQVVEVTVSALLSINCCNSDLISPNNSKIQRQNPPGDIESLIWALEALQ